MALKGYALYILFDDGSEFCIYVALFHSSSFKFLCIATRTNLFLNYSL